MTVIDGRDRFPGDNERRSVAESFALARVMLSEAKKRRDERHARMLDELAADPLRSKTQQPEKDPA